MLFLAQAWKEHLIRNEYWLDRCEQLMALLAPLSLSLSLWCYTTTNTGGAAPTITSLYQSSKQIESHSPPPCFTTQDTLLASKQFEMFFAGTSPKVFGRIAFQEILQLALDIALILLRPGRGRNVGDARLVVTIVVNLDRMTHIGVPPNRIAGVHLRDADHALAQPKVGVRRRAQQLAIGSERSRKPRSFRVECPLARIPDIFFRVRVRCSEKWPQQQIGNGPFDVGIQHQATLTRSCRGQRGPALEASEDSRVGRPRKHGLIGVLAHGQIVDVQQFWVARENGGVE